MPVDVSRTLRQAVTKLEGERVRIDRQIAALRQALGITARSADGAPSARSSTRRRARRRMSATQRKAVSARMRAYWAKRRGRSEKKAKAGAK